MPTAEAFLQWLCHCHRAIATTMEEGLSCRGHDLQPLLSSFMAKRAGSFESLGDALCHQVRVYLEKNGAAEYGEKGQEMGSLTHSHVAPTTGILEESYQYCPG